MESLNIIKVTSLSEDQFRQIDKLWDNELPAMHNGEFPWWMKMLQEMYYYIVDDGTGKIIAWVMVFFRENQVKIAFIIDRAHQRKGLGSMLLEKIKSENDELHGWVIDHNNEKRKDGTVYPSPLQFFVKNGFEVFHDIRFQNPRGIEAVKIRWVSK